MIINGLFGHWQTWVLLAAAWIGLGALTAIAFGIIARMGEGEEGGE